MAGCESFCTKAECAELRARISALEEAFRFHENLPIPQAHEYFHSHSPTVNLTCSEEQLTVVVTLDEEADSDSCNLKGLKGEKGETGDRGEPGPQGEKGDKGEQGIQGEKGEKGDRGEQGLQGEKGDKGDKGEQGIQGEKGDQGKKGETGERGYPGFNGADGEKGEKGEDGLSIVGPRGPAGLQGPPGQDADSSLISSIQDDLEDLKQQLGGGGMSLKDLDQKLDDILTKINDCCIKVEGNGQAISDVGQAVSVSDSNSEQRSEVLGAQIEVARQECSNGFTFIGFRQEGQKADLNEILEYLYRIEGTTQTIEDELTKQDNINTGACIINPLTGLKTFNPNQNNHAVTGISGYLKTLFPYLVDIHKTICSNTSNTNADVEKIWKVLGGDSIFTVAPDGSIVEKIVNVEKEMRKDVNDAFFPLSPDALKGDIRIKHLPDYLRAIGATEHYRSGHYRYDEDYKLIPDMTMSVKELKKALGLAEETEIDFNTLTEEQEKQLATLQIDDDDEKWRWQYNQIMETLGKVPLQFKITKDHPLIQDFDLLTFQWTEFGVLPPIFGTGNTGFSPGIRYQLDIKDAPENLNYEISSLSDGITEVMGLIVGDMTNNKIVKELILRAMSEIASIKQMTITQFSKIEAMQAYLGCKFKEEAGEYDLMFNPYSQDSDEQFIEAIRILEPVKTKYKRDVFDGGGSETLAAYLKQLLHSAMIIRAKYFKGTDVKNINDSFMTKYNITRDIINAIDLSREILSPDQPNPTPENPDKTDFDDFLEAVEKGFSKTVGDIDNDGKPKDPYGRNYDERPKIKRHKGNVKE